MIHIDVTLIQIDLRPKGSASSISVRKLGSQCASLEVIVISAPQSSLNPKGWKLSNVIPRKDIVKGYGLLPAECGQGHWMAQQ